MSNITVTAVNEVWRYSSESETLFAVTATDTPPSPPLNPRVVRTSGSAILVRWDHAFDSGGIPVRGYRTYIGVSGSNSASLEPVCDGIATSCLLAGLARNTSYEVFGLTYTQLRVGSPGDVLEASTTANYTAPGQAPPVQAPSLLHDGANVSFVWEAPADDGGLPITHYVVRYWPPLAADNITVGNNTMWTGPVEPSTMDTQTVDAQLSSNSTMCINVTTLNATELLGSNITEAPTDEALIEAYLRQRGFNGTFVESVWREGERVNGTVVVTNTSLLNGTLPVPLCQAPNRTVDTYKPGLEPAVDIPDPLRHWPQRRVDSSTFQWLFELVNASAPEAVGFEVRAASAFGEGPWSETLVHNHTVPDLFVTDVTLRSYASTWATISWTPPAPSLLLLYTGYKVRPRDAAHQRGVQ